MSAKVALPTAMAAITGFLVGWWYEFGRIMDARRPNGCDGPCVFLAAEYHGEALLFGVVAGLASGLLVFGLAMLVLARRTPDPDETR